MKPNIEVIRKWVAALRSGEYKQGKKALRTDEGFCCLGVLCDLNQKEGGGEWSSNFSGRFIYTAAAEKHAEGTTGHLPHFVRVWAGIIYADPVIEGNTLSFLNDTGHTFDRIADLIERAYLNETEHSSH